jgi:tetratricopeptide (TPR) repeat protein
MFTGQMEGLSEMTSEALALAEAREDWFLVAFSEGGMAQWDAEQGDLESAMSRLRRATQAAARSGNPSVIAFSALSEGRVAGFSGQLDEARRAYDRAISSYQQLGDPRLELVSRSDFAHALRMGGELDAAEAIYRRTLHDWLHAGNRGAIANQLESFALIALERDDPLRAARLLGAAEAIREAASAPMLPFEQAENDAAVARLRKDPGRAATVDNAWAEGRRMTIDEGVAFALSQPGTEGATADPSD